LEQNRFFSDAIILFNITHIYVLVQRQILSVFVFGGCIGAVNLTLYLLANYIFIFICCDGFVNLEICVLIYLMVSLDPLVELLSFLFRESDFLVQSSILDVYFRLSTYPNVKFVGLLSNLQEFLVFLFFLDVNLVELISH